MKFEVLLKLLNGEPLFSSSLLLAGNVSQETIHKQLSRWVAKGKLTQLRRGLYALSGPYLKTELHPFLIANMLKKASYISMQSALGHYNMIPEYVPVTTCITTGRPEEINTGLGKYIFRHIKKNLFWGYSEMELARKNRVFIATIEKALLDLIYLTPDSDSIDFINELRLQNTEKINITTLRQYSNKFGTPKMQRAANLLIDTLKI
jgi:predicted transcriptional regulator of viral defense system